METPFFDAVVFDFDGTLAELTIDFDLMKRRLAALAECYLPSRPEGNGLPALEWVEELGLGVEREHGRDTALEFRTRCRFLIMDMELAAARAGALFPFTRGVLAGLRARGTATAIITRNCLPAVRIVFPDAAEHVGCLVAREDAPRVKPDPAHILTALARLGVPPEKCLMVGDHPLDVETARRAGARAGAVASGRTSREVLEAAGADWVAGDCRKLLEGLGLAGHFPEEDL